MLYSYSDFRDATLGLVWQKTRYQELPKETPCVDPTPTGPTGKRLSMNVQRCPWSAAGNTYATTRGPIGAYIPCGPTAARRDISAAHQGPGEAGSPQHSHTTGGSALW